MERLARQVFHADLAHTVLAVPIAQERATMHLDTVCTMVDVDKVVMYPNVADSLRAYAVTVVDRGDPDTELVLHVADAEPFLVAAAKAMEIDTLHQIDTGLDPVTAEREQWDDGNNTLALAPRVAVAYERNDETNHRLEEAGIEVVRIAGSELGSGPRRPALHELPDHPGAAAGAVSPGPATARVRPSVRRSVGRDRGHRPALDTAGAVGKDRRGEHAGEQPLRKAYMSVSFFDAFTPRRWRGSAPPGRPSRCPRAGHRSGRSTPADKAYVLLDGTVSVRVKGEEVAQLGRRRDHRRGRDRRTTPCAPPRSWR